MIRFKQWWRSPATRATWLGAMTAMVLLFALILLVGCTSVVPPGPCQTCVGPYNLVLDSHREALFGKDHRR